MVAARNAWWWPEWRDGEENTLVATRTDAEDGPDQETDPNAALIPKLMWKEHERRRDHRVREGGKAETLKASREISPRWSS